MVLTWDLGPPLGAEVAPMLSQPLRASMDRVEQRWGDLCRSVGARHQLPDGWLQSMIWRESGGNPKAFRQERDKLGTPIVVNGRLLTGIGLMQITSPALKGQRSDVQLYDPALNVELGARYVSELASRKDTRGTDGKPDFPRIAAGFNAGSVRDSSRNRWGMVQTTGHVDAEVAAFNYWLAAKMADAQRAAAVAVAHQFGGLELLPDLDSVADEMGEDDEPSA